MWWKSDGIRHLRTARLLLFMLLFRRAACQQVFFDTTLAYEPAAVRVPSQLTLSLRVDSETGIRKPARVVLHLPGFVLPGATDETQVELGGEGASYFELQAVWSPTSEYLILKLNHTDTALKNQTLSLLLVDYFRLPETGLSKNSPDLMLALSRDRKDVLGDLSWAAFRQSPAVGSFYNAGSPTELTWRKDQTRPSFQAGQAATVILHFYGHMRFFRGDSVTVTLPGFTGLNGPVPLLTGEGSSADFTASWDAANFRLVFTYNSIAVRASDQRTSLYTAPHVAIDVHGLAVDSPELTIETNAAEGPVMPTPIQRSTSVLPLVFESVAIFSRSFCEFKGFRWHCEKRPPVASLAAELVFSIRLAKPLMASAQIRLVLKGYRGASKAIPISDTPLLDPGSPEGVEFKFEQNPYGCPSNDACSALDYVGKGPIPLAQWDDASQTMTLATTREISANATIRIVVPSSAGIHLPSRGVPVASILQHVTQFSMQVESEFTPLSSFARLNPPIGAFRRFSIEFGSDVRPSEEISAFIVSLVPEMELNVGDVVKVRLQDFGGSEDKQFFVNADDEPGSNGEGIISWVVTWEMRKQLLSLSPQGRVWARANVRLVLNQGATGIFLIPPTEGTQRIEPPRILDVQVESKEGFIAPLVLTPTTQPGVTSSKQNATIQRIPSLIDATSITFDSTEVTPNPPILPGGRTEMTFTFTTTVAMDVGDEIVLLLPGFHISGTNVGAAIGITNDVTDTNDLRGTWKQSHIPQLRLAVAKRLPERNIVRAKIPASAAFGILLPTAGVPARSDESGADGFRISATVRGKAVQSIPIEIVDNVPPSIVRSRLAFGTPRAGETSEIFLSIVLAAGMKLQSGDTFVVDLTDFVRKVSVSDSVIALPAGSVSQASWSSSLQRLTISITNEVSSSLNVTIPQDFGLALPTRGLVSDTASRYAFEIFRGASKLFGKTSISDIEFVAAMYDPLMRFSPSEAGANVDIQIWVTFTGPLPSGTTIKWRLPGFEGESVEKIATTSYPAESLPEASWLSDDGSGAGVLSVQVGARQVDADVVLRVEIPKSAGIRLPPAGMQDCTEPSSNECGITIEVESDSANAGRLLRTIFRGSDLVGVASMASLSLTPKQVKTPITLSFQFETSFDARAGDLLEIVLKQFSGAQPILVIEDPDGLCGASKCFRDVLISSGTQVTLFANMGTDVLRGSTITLRVPATAGLEMPDHGLPRFSSSLGLAGSDLISFSFKRKATGPDLPGAGPTDRFVLLIKERSFIETPIIGSFSAALEISPRHPGVVVGLAFELLLSMSLRRGEHINIDLSGFLRNTPSRPRDERPVNIHSHSDCGSSACTDLEVVWITLEEKIQGQIQSIERYRNATWDNAAKRISWENRIDKQAGTRLRMLIDAEEGFVTPPSGIPTIEAMPKISSDAYDGSVDRTPVNAQLLKPFIIDTEISYVPAKASAETELSFSVLTNADMETGDIIRLTLKNFTGGMRCWTSDEFKDQRCMLEVADNPMICSSCRLWDGSYSKLCECRGEIGSQTCSMLPIKRMGCVMRVQATDAPSLTPSPTRIGAPGCECLNVSSLVINQIWSGLAGPPRPSLPAGYGASCVAWDFTPGYSTSPDESRGPSCSEIWPSPASATSIETLRVGTSELMDAQLGLWCCLPWCFVNASVCKYHTPWAGGAGLSVSYDACAGGDRRGRLESCPFAPLRPREGYGVSASWVGSSSQLVLTLTGPFQRGAKLSVVIPQSNGIQVPAGGLEMNDPFLTVDARNKVGRMDPFRIEVSPPVGIKAGPATLKFGDPAAAQAVSTTIQMSFSQQMEAGEEIFCTLPSFDDAAPGDRQGRVVRVTSSASSSSGSVVVTSVVAQAFWNPTSSILTLIIGKKIPKAHTILVTILPNQIHLPASGVRAASPEQLGFKLWTKSALSPIPREPPTFFDAVQPVGAWWYTYLGFEPSVVNTPTSLQLQFVSMMPLAFLDVIEIPLPGIEGPAVPGRRLTPVKELPATGAFEVVWSREEGVGKPGRLSIKVLKPIEPESACAVHLPATCMFKTPAGECDEDKYLIITSLDNPSAFTMSTSASAGPTVSTPIRLVQHVSQNQSLGPFGAFQGEWTGETLITAGYKKGNTAPGSVPDRAYCVSDAISCPSMADYTCYPLRQASIVRVGPGALRISTETAEAFIDGLGESFVMSGGSFKASFLQQNGDRVELKNETSTKPQSFCIRARSLNLVDVDGTWTRVLEFRWGATYRARGSGRQKLRLRLKIISIKEFNPFNLDLSDPRNQGWVLSALSDIARVPVQNVRFVAGKYPPVEKCFKEEICFFEAAITADTVEQQVAVENWASSIRDAVVSTELEAIFSGYGFFAKAELAEDIAQLLEYTTNPECPNPHGQGFAWTPSASSSFAFESWGVNVRSRARDTKVPQVSAVYGSWQNSPALRGVPALSAMEGSGTNGNASASCLFAQGSHDGDKIVYEDAYTLTFTYSAFLRQTSESVDDADLMEGTTADALNATNATDMDSAARGVKTIEFERCILCALISFLCWCGLVR